MTTLVKNISRESFHLLFTQISFFLFRNFLLLILLYPAFFCSCNAEESPAPLDQQEKEVQRAVRLYGADSGWMSDIKTLDAFVFNDDALQRLDSYQRFDEIDGQTVTIASTKGEKIISFCANSQKARYDWAIISSRSSLERVNSDLERERRKSPLMTGEIKIDTEGNRIDEIGIYPLINEITLNSICCDFSGKPYEGEELKDIKVYLINVNAECSIMETDKTLPVRIINSGALDLEDVAKFTEPDLIFQTFDKPVGDKRLTPEISLWCYPNASKEESPGSPITRLVIEGTIDGKVCYYPIDVMMYDSGPRNHRYIYNLKFMSMGTDDPNTPIDTETADINMEIRQWNEKENCEIVF